MLLFLVGIFLQKGRFTKILVRQKKIEVGWFEEQILGSFELGGDVRSFEMVVIGACSMFVADQPTKFPEVFPN